MAADLTTAMQLQRAGRLPDAAAEYHRLLLLKPDWVEAHYQLAMVLIAQRDADRAIAELRAAIALRPDFAGAMSDLAVLLVNAGQLDEAISLHRQALALRPDLFPIYNNLAAALREKGLPQEAIAVLHRALEMEPNSFPVWANLASCLNDAGNFDDATDACRRALALNPNDPSVLVLLGVILKDSGQLDQALACFDRAIAVNPDHPLAADQRLYTLHFHPAFNGTAILQEQLKWASRFSPRPRKSAASSATGRRLRIGYVSPDFGRHVIGRNILPLLRRHDRTSFEIFGYSNHTRSDPMTDRLQTCCDQWRHITGKSHQRVEQMIRQDQIDILVDLTLHMAGNRLPVLAQRPAPVQVTFGGYPAGTGLEAIDYRLTDPYLDPPENDSFYVERSIRVPHSFWCYDVEGMDLEKTGDVGPLPALTAGHVTFACLNNFCKVNDAVLDLWARVLAAVPDSRLLLLGGIGSFCRRAADRLAASGIAVDRLQFAGRLSRLPYLDRYRQVDLGLDSFPYNGHTTSLDSLWMGVPVVTLVGQTAVGRAGLSQLSNLGLTELATRTPDEFVSVATNLALDLPRLGQLRTGLRDRMRRSPLMDAAGFARDIEEAYRQMWQEVNQNVS